MTNASDGTISNFGSSFASQLIAVRDAEGERAFADSFRHQSCSSSQHASSHVHVESLVTG